MSTELIKKRVEELKALQANPYPTPPVGTPIVWFNAAKRDENRPYDDAVASIVTKIDGPGKVTLVAFSPHAMPSHKRSSHHVSHPIHKVRMNSVSVDSGSWDYPEGVRPHKDHYQIHLAEIQRQLEECDANLKTQESVAKSGK